MAPKPSFDEKRLRDAKMLQQEFSKSGGAKRSRGQSRPLPDASRNPRRASASCAQSVISGRPEDEQLGVRRMPQPKLVAQPNLNAVPAARADKDMQDWLNGVSHDKEKKANVHQSVNENAKSPRADENAMPQNAPKTQARTSTKALSNQTERSQKDAQRNTAPTESTLSKKTDLDTPSSVEALKQASAPTKGVAMVEASSASTHNSRAVQPGCNYATGTVGDANEFSGLTIVAQWHLRRQARRKEGAQTKSPDLLDVNSPPITPPSNFFEKEDMPLSLPAPIVPSQGSHEGPMTPIEEDLMQFPDPNTGKGFGVLISDPTECRTAEESPVIGTETWVQPTAFPTAGHEVRTTIPFSAEKKLGAAAEAQGNNFVNARKSIKAQGSSGCHHTGQSEKSTVTNRKVETAPESVPQFEFCGCNTNKPVTTFRGLSSSKWACPGYQHQGDFPRNTEMLKHKPTCPARVVWEKKYPLESGTILTVQPKVTHLPEGFQFVCPLQSKDLTPTPFHSAPSSTDLSRSWLTGKFQPTAGLIPVSWGDRNDGLKC